MAITENKYIDGVLHQKCTKCGEWKPADDAHYGPTKQRDLGILGVCRICTREAARAYHARKYESKRIRKRHYTSIPLDAPPIKKSPLPDEFKSFYKHITSCLDSQARYKAYLISCKTTGQHYIGITERKLETRWMQHLREANKQGGYLLHQTISQYGIWDFEFKYVASAKTRMDLHELEKQLIRQYDSVENGYNQTRGGSNSESVGNPVVVNGVQFISLNSAARHYGVEESVVHQRMKRCSFTLEEALGIDTRQKHPPKRNLYEVEGHIYPNFTEACRQYGLEDSAVRSRLKLGWTIVQAFGIEPPPPLGRNAYGKSVTINGTEFRTIVDAARHYKAQEYTITWRLRNGWTPEQAVGIADPPPPIGEKNGKSITVEGTTYSSLKKATTAYGLNIGMVSSRINNLGWTVEQAFGLEPPPSREGTNGKQIIVDGITYESLNQAARSYNLKPAMVRKRIAKFGWTIEQAFGLAEPSKKPSNSAKKITLRGIVYESIKSACNAFNITSSAVERRVKRGWSLEDAITVTSQKSKTV